MIYEFQSRARYSECDHRGTLTLASIVNYFQDCSTFQSEDIGVGTEYLKAKGRAWILSYWQIIIDRYPKLYEPIAVGTFATEFKGLFGNRNFYLKGADGEMAARAYSVWVFMDMQKGRPVRPAPEDILPYGTEEPLVMPYEGRKIAVPKIGQKQEPFAVKRHFIDTNEHVNNSQYIQMAMEFLPRDMVVRQVRVDYKKSAKLGDVIYPGMTVEDDRTVVELCAEDGSIYAVIEFK